MCKNSENGTKLPISRKYAVEKRHGATALQAARTWRARLRWPALRGYRTDSTGKARWPVVRF